MEESGQSLRVGWRPGMRSSMQCMTIEGTDLKMSRVGLGNWAIRGRMWGEASRPERWLQMLSMCPQSVADGQEDAMRSIQEIILSLMIVVGLSMIVYDIINARTGARTVERKNLLKKKLARWR